MRVVLIDDEQLALDYLEIQLMNLMEEMKVVGKYTNPLDALPTIEKSRVDVVFVDMEMGAVHGLEFAEKLMSIPGNFDVVFVTAHPQFALEAFEVNAIDYLLKPVTKTRLKNTLTKLVGRKNITKSGKTMDKKESTYLVIQSFGKFHLFDLNRNPVKWRTKKVKELFIYLWLQQDTGSNKDRLMEDLWPDSPPDKISTRLHTTVYQLRRTLKDIGIPNAISFTNNYYILNAPIKSDLSELEKGMKSKKDETLHIERSLELVKGDFLEEENYDWSIQKQQTIRQTYLQYLEYSLTSLKDKTNYALLVERCLEKMITIDPYNEKYNYHLIEHYGESKNITKMIDQFQSFKEKWNNDLGLDIPKGIVQLYRSFLKD